MQRGIAPSIMCADPLHLERDIRALERAGSAYFHFDVMDGRFVPNFCLGPDLIRAVRQISGMPADIHLMVEEPDRHLSLFPIREGDVVSVHQEACVHLQRTLRHIRELGAHPAVALNPGTPLCMVEELLPDLDMLLLMSVNPALPGRSWCRRCWTRSAGAPAAGPAGRQDALIELDGNVSPENAVKMRDAGADIYVAGTSAVFRAPGSIEENMAALRRRLEERD